MVKERVANAASVYAVDSQLVQQLEPTHIITQTQCKVCAVSLEDVEPALQAQIATPARIVCLEPYALADVWRDILSVASACGCSDVGHALVESLQSRITAIQRLAQTATSRPTIAALEWFEPLMAGGNWVPELIELASGKNLFGVAGQHSPWMTWDDLVAANPDVIVALPCGFDLSRTRSEMYWLTNRPAWQKLKAVRTGQVFLCDGNQFMNRPGPRLVESLQIFAEILHPELFKPTLEYEGWERWRA